MHITEMNHCRILYFMPVLAMLAACTNINVSKPTQLNVEAVSVSTGSATVNLVVTGDLPTSCRVAPPVLKSLFDATTAPEEELCAYLDETGEQVSLPVALEYDGLQASSEYLLIVGWTSDGKDNYKVGQFKTLAPAELTFSLALEGASWGLGDKAGIVSYDRIETSNSNVVADFNYSVSAGEAVFMPSAELEMPRLGQERLYVYCPYDENTRLNESDFCVHSVLPDVQRGDGGPDLMHSWAVCDVTNSSTNLSLALKKALCKVEFDINLSEYPGYGLRKISLFDALGNAMLSGEYAVDPEKEIVKAVSGHSQSSVTAEMENLSSEGKASVVLIPGDYSGSDIILMIYLENSKGELYTVPLRCSDEFNLKPGDVKLVKIESLKSSENPYPWFEYNESRDMLGGVAYGSQNTWCVESGGSVTFEVKARGDILNATVPKYYGIMLASNVKSEKLLSLPDGTDAFEQSPTREIPDDYRITVNCCSGTTASFGVVAIYDENHNVLWSFMIWKYEAGDPIGEVRYSGISSYSFMDRALGARKSIAAALKDGKAGGGAAYFNWGRKDPFPWKSEIPTQYLKESGALRNMQYAIAHPNIMLSMAGSSDSEKLYNWCSDQRRDLWGAENKTTSENRNIKGHKTIYDPCPEGYRVPDYDALYLVNTKKALAEKEFSTSDKRYSLQHSGNHLDMPCPFSDMSAFAIEKEDGGYDYWLYHGLLWGSTSAWSNTTTDALVTAYSYWSNSNQSTSNWNGVMLQGWYNGGGTSWFLNSAGKMADAYTVRCQKEK